MCSCGFDLRPRKRAGLHCADRSTGGAVRAPLRDYRTSPAKTVTIAHLGEAMLSCFDPGFPAHPLFYSPVREEKSSHLLPTMHKFGMCWLNFADRSILSANQSQLQLATAHSANGSLPRIPSDAQLRGQIPTAVCLAETACTPSRSLLNSWTSRDVKAYGEGGIRDFAPAYEIREGSIHRRSPDYALYGRTGPCSSPIGASALARSGSLIFFFRAARVSYARWPAKHDAGILPAWLCPPNREFRCSSSAATETLQAGRTRGTHTLPFSALHSNRGNSRGAVNDSNGFES